MASLIYARERAMWILNHAGEYDFQRRRANLLQAAYDDRRRQLAGTGFNRHVQAITEKFYLRATASRAAWKETLVVLGCAVIFPVAWPLGRWLYLALVRRVEHVRASGRNEGLWSIPITFLAWIGVAVLAIGAAAIGLSSPTTFLGVLALPAIVVQGAGMFLMASVYGILEGWIAVPGTTGWWPYPPPTLPPAGSLAVQGDSHTAGAPPPPGIDAPPKPFRVNKKASKSTPAPWS
ncbi:hypothetical protein BB737_14910 [Mycobacterium avium subsp. hominissuis]|uniref:Uncharacterized protein n=2 Tax=Mycobacterium TaxID=1763 RepID=A0AA37V4B2_9MYCO|nr:MULTISPECIES: hypothetical protein [Mycobacterium]APA78416.1 hypothetical protein KV38_24540 [Mycobacterium avium subsp. hominissuis]PBJ39152.1 hypothetical protein XV03_04025 [Mycobacterium avium subsp. hominissuis]PBJ65037.1 hypothetical protein BB737_14910 [Mycobacterium avium subsp. hominissuis]GLB86312.1 hypothetical protein SRL2020028_55680 [Mycobacterium kiyosense]